MSGRNALHPLQWDYSFTPPTATPAMMNLLKEKYTIRECIELTKGQYGAEAFAKFFEE